MKKLTLTDRLRYRFDLTMARGAASLIVWLFALMAVLVTAAAVVLNSAAIAVLADKDKVEMEDELHDKCGPLHNTRVVCRTGSPIDPAELSIVRPDAARSIIVLAPEDDSTLMLGAQAPRFEAKVARSPRLPVHLRNATPTVFHQRHVRRVLRSSCNARGRRPASPASSRGREPRPGRCPPLWPGDLRNDGGSVGAAGAGGSEA